MSNLEKISAYLENTMPEAEKQQFEQAVANDAELRRELNLQNDIIEGIKETRRLQIKAMLDKIPVGGGSVGGSMLMGKIISGIAIVGVLTYGTYYLMQKDEATDTVQEQEVTNSQPEEQMMDNEPVTENVNTTESDKIEEVKPATPVETSKQAKSSDIEKNEVATSHEVEINKPSQAPMFETGENDSLEAPTNAIVEKVEGNLTSLDVEIDNTRKKYSFHYQFNQGKLFLYGDFDKGLYEILEFKTTNNKMLFLYYKDKFYPLDKKQVRITELEPVKEQSLIEKLEKVAQINQE